MQFERSHSTSRAASTSITGEDRDEPSWRAILDAMADPALVLDEAGTVVHHNPLVADLYPRVRVGHPVTLLSREPVLLAAIDQARHSDERNVVHLHDRVPVARRMSAFISRISGDEPSPGSPAILVVLRDLTDQEKHAQMRSDFIAHASHELRTPLASLKLIVETLQGPARQDPDKRERFLSMMLVQATRMAQLIDDLLSLSRVEMRVHLPPHGTVELTELLETVVQSLEPLAEANDVSLHLDSETGPVFVRGEREELAQVFQNLVQNAIRYGKNGGDTKVLIDRAKGSSNGASTIRVAVQDDGIGIAAEHIPRLTERFYRVSAVDSRAKGGTGLGLAIVKHIAMRHRADLEITSELGRGSTFTVSFEEAASNQYKQTIE
ncbi:MAG: ATP-binding protein [Hyphomicrobiaceae bacterium]